MKGLQTGCFLYKLRYNIFYCTTRNCSNTTENGSPNCSCNGSKPRDGQGTASRPAILLGFIFLSSLFKKILEFARNRGYTKTFYPVVLHVAYIAIALLSYTPEPYLLLSILSFVAFIQPFEAFNFAKMNTPGVNAVQKNSLSTRQMVLMVFGGLLLFTGLIGIFLGAH